METEPSPLLDLPGAVPGPDGVDQPVAWHYGDPHGEQRQLAAGLGFADLSHRDVVTVTGPDRLGWLHDLTTAHLAQLAPGTSALALILDPHGHVEHELHLVDDGDVTWISVESGTGPVLTGYLDRMRFLREVRVHLVTQQWAVVWRAGTGGPGNGVLGWQPPPEFAGTGRTVAGADRGGDAGKYVPHRPAAWRGREELVPRPELARYARSAGPPAGTWALEALRTAAAVPRLGFETDHRTLPHEVGWIGSAVHLAKGCYRGQETVARVHNLGRPPRRLVLLHLDGSAGELPPHATPVHSSAGRTVGWVATAARHYELGPIATAVIKSSVPADSELLLPLGGASSIAASQQTVVVV